MGWLGVALLILLATAGYLWQDNSALLTLISVVAGVNLTLIVEENRAREPRLAWPAFVCATRYRYRLIRISFSYIYAIPVEDRQLLIKGRRLPNQFQPVGGVYKARATGQLGHHFGALADVRFKSDHLTNHDLRLRVPGKSMVKFVNWFFTGQDRELMPLREFYEELVTSGILDATVFRSIDFRARGVHYLPLHRDPHSGLIQLIVANVFELMPTPPQEAALKSLYESWSKAPRDDIHFASTTEIEKRGTADGEHREFDIAPTAKWLIGSGA